MRYRPDAEVVAFTGGTAGLGAGTTVSGATGATSAAGGAAGAAGAAGAGLLSATGAVAPEAGSAAGGSCAGVDEFGTVPGDVGDCGSPAVDAGTVGGLGSEVAFSAALAWYPAIIPTKASAVAEVMIVRVPAAGCARLVIVLFTVLVLVTFVVGVVVVRFGFVRFGIRND